MKTRTLIGLLHRIAIVSTMLLGFAALVIGGGVLLATAIGNAPPLGSFILALSLFFASAVSHGIEVLLERKA